MVELKWVWRVFVTKTRIPNKNYKSFQYDIPNESSTLFLDEFSINPFKKLIQSSMDGHGLDIDLGLLVSEMLIKLRIMYEKNIKVETAFAAETFENFKKKVLNNMNNIRLAYWGFGANFSFSCSSFES